MTEKEMTLEQAKAKIARLEELLESSNALSWIRAKEILRMRDEIKKLKGEKDGN